MLSNGIMMSEPVDATSGAKATVASVPVTAMVFTLNEELNLPGCLDSLRWCDDVIVIDSFSSDGTETICRERNVRFFQHEFRGFGTQRNWALDNTSPRHEWILILDADERTPPDLVHELAERLTSNPDPTAAFRVRRRFHFWGRWLRHSSLYPTWVVRLVHRDRVRYVDRGHGETQEVSGPIDALEADLIDENLKGVADWLERQVRYARKDALYELQWEAAPFPYVDLLASDPLVRRAALKRVAYGAPGRAPLYFVYSYFLRGGFKDGLDGFVFCTMRAMYQQMIAINKYDVRRSARDL
jgi:glycosyltransferase involved in cell wall biosynthesis